MDRIGLLVLGSQAPLILDAVLDGLDDARFRVFLHVDAKLPLEHYTRPLRNLARITLVEPRTKVFWGGFSMIEAETTLIRAALADPSIRTFTMLSDDAAPVRRADVLYTALRDGPNRMSFDLRDDVQPWYRGFYCPDAEFSMYRDRAWQERTVSETDLDTLRRLVALRERGKKPLDRVFFSRQWWSLDRPTLESILRVMDEDTHLTESFRFSVMSDELMFATIFQLLHPGRVTLGVPMCMHFTPHCRTFHTPAELAELRVQPDHLFARKLHPERTELVEAARALGDRIDVAVGLSPHGG